MPTTDWQFWVVTTIAAAALWRVARLVVGVIAPMLGKARPPSKRASLTISAPSGKPR